MIALMLSVAVLVFVSVLLISAVREARHRKRIRRL